MRCSIWWKIFWSHNHYVAGQVRTLLFVAFPSAIAVDSFQNLFVTNSLASTVTKIVTSCERLFFQYVSIFFVTSQFFLWCCFLVHWNLVQCSAGYYPDGSNCAASPSGEFETLLLQYFFGVICRLQFVFCTGSYKPASSSSGVYYKCPDTNPSSSVCSPPLVKELGLFHRVSTQPTNICGKIE